MSTLSVNAIQTLSGGKHARVVMSSAGSQVGGSITITCGWSSANGGTGHRPYIYINPVQGRNDGRRRGPSYSKFTIFEVLI